MDLPEEWTYGGLLDWSSKDKLKLAPAGLVLRCIRAALNERLGMDYDARTIPELSSTYHAVRDDYAQAIGQDMLKALYGDTWDQEEQVFQWADYRTRSSWAGATDIDDIAPRFTEETLLDAINEEELLSAPGRLSPLTPDWIYQQYKLLNAMRYRCCTKTQGTLALYVSGASLSWADAEYVYRNDPQVGTTDGTYIASYANAPVYSLTRSGYAYSASCYGSSNAFFEWYFKVVAVSNGTFHAQGYNVVENEFSLIHTSPEKGNRSFSIQDPDLSNPPPARPASGSVGWKLASPWWEVNDYKPVAIYDFMFKDW